MIVSTFCCPPPSWLLLLNRNIMPHTQLKQRLVQSVLGRQHRNPWRILIERFLKEQVARFEVPLRVLDAGAGDGRYRPIFVSHLYESCDFQQHEHKCYGELNYVCDLAKLPMDEATYDVVVCTQVLAHLPEPSQALAEFHRVLKPGGELWLTCPLVFQENEAPYDFFRFTRYGLDHLLSRAGFDPVTIEPLDGYLGLAQYHFGMAARTLPIRPSAYGDGALAWVAGAVALVGKPFCALACVLYAELEVRAPRGVLGMNSNWRVVAQRPSSQPSCPGVKSP